MKRDLSIPDRHQFRICVDTVKNPMKGRFLGGMTADEAESLLRHKFSMTEASIQSLKKGN